MNESTLAPILSPAPVTFFRRAVASGAFAWLFGMILPLGPPGALTFAMAISFAVAALAVQSANLLAQVLAASIGGSSLLLSALICGLSQRVQIDPWLMLFASSLPLLAMGRDALFGPDARAQFAPLASRTGFVLSSVGALVSGGALLALALTAIADRRMTLALAGAPLAVVAGVGALAMLRMRAWGLLAAATAGGTSLLLAVALQIRALPIHHGLRHHELATVSAVFFLCGLGALAVLLPLASAKVSCRRLRPPSIHASSPRAALRLRARPLHDDRERAIAAAAAERDASATAASGDGRGADHLHEHDAGADTFGAASGVRGLGGRT